MRHEPERRVKVAHFDVETRDFDAKFHRSSRPEAREDQHGQTFGDRVVAADGRRQPHLAHAAGKIEV